MKASTSSRRMEKEWGRITRRTRCERFRRMLAWTAGLILLMGMDRKLSRRPESWSRTAEIQKDAVQLGSEGGGRSCFLFGDSSCSERQLGFCLATVAVLNVS